MSTTSDLLQCEGCGFTVPDDLVVQDLASIALAFGWKITKTPPGEEREWERLCPVCVEKQRTYVSPLIVPGQEKKPKPIPRHKLFQQPVPALQPVAQPRDPKKRLIALFRETVDLVETHFSHVPDGIQWSEHDRSTWQVGVIRRALAQKGEVQG